MIMVATSSNIHRQQARDSGEPMIHFSVNVSSLETQQEPMLQFKLKGQEKTNVPTQRHSAERNSLLLVGGLPFLFYSGL